MIIDTEALPNRDRYKLLIGSILPRPIAWVSTVDSEGRHNLAPFSFFNAACVNPMTLMFTVGVPGETGSRKDTLRNIEETGEFVINLTDAATAEAMSLCATDLPHGVSEFDWAKVTPAPCEVVNPPRVAEAPVSFECVLREIVTLSDEPGGSSLVLGSVRRVHVRDELYDNGRIDLDAYAPVGRLGGDWYTRVTDRFEIRRVPAPKPK